MKVYLSSSRNKTFYVLLLLLCQFALQINLFGQNTAIAAGSASPCYWGAATTTEAPCSSCPACTWTAGAPNNPTNNNTDVTIGNNKTVILTSNWALGNGSRILINTGATLYVANGVTLSFRNLGAGSGLVVNGTLSGSGTLNVGTASAGNVSGTGSVTVGCTGNCSATCTASCPSGPLPVNLLYFTVRSENSMANLTWATASEINNSHFVVKRSTDGTNYTSIGVVQGHGTTTTQQAYGFIDSSPLMGLSYYRIVQYDYDGKFRVYPTAEFNGASAKRISVYPIPATVGSDILISFSLDKEVSSISVDLINANGQMIQSVKLTLASQKTGFVSFATGSLKPELYVVRVRADSELFTSRVLLLNP